MIKKIDKKNRFVSMFNPDTGFYMRSGIIDENGKISDWKIDIEDFQPSEED